MWARWATFVHLIAFIGQGYLSWMILRWIAGNLSSNGQPLPISFNGSALTYIGWHVLLFISAITIVGWAWVAVAQMRWICRNIGGTQREVMFNATGLEMLWRTLVFVIACMFIIPIPWMMRWYVQWAISQFELVERAALTALNRYFRSRSEPSCATEATSVPSCLKIMPRVRPRPPCALGESCAYNSHSSARNGR